MTHGEEPGPETHTDSAVLTYLEGLLMHPVAAGPGATATRRSEAANGNQEQVNKAARPFQLPHGPSAPKPGNGPSLGSSQNLKKARLLCSGAWNQPGAPRLSSPPAELNGQGGGLPNGALEGSPHGGESTLLASLLQSFSSRLQSVAMSQQGSKPAGSERSPPPLPPPEAPSPSADKETLPCYGTASSRLKGLMRKSKLQNHNATPYSRRGPAQERSSESPRSAHSATPPSANTDAVSCAERLKAVANLVKIRSSPAPSPKPSVACSQLALLLSSEAHLQQYSREHALKAQISSRSASERLAAMATQQGQDNRPPSAGNAEPPGPRNTPNGTAAGAPALPPPPANSSQQNSSLLASPVSPRPTPPPPLPSHPQPHPQARSHGQPAREKRGFDARPARPPQTCSSLLLLLLNNHNNQKQLTKNGHLEDDLGALPPSRGSSVTSDSDCSAHERSLAKESSDAESSYSSCSPIDLSMRGRAGATDPGPKSHSSSFSSSASSSSAVFSSSAPAAFSPSPHRLSSSSTPAFSACSAALSSSTAFSSSSSSSLDKLTESLINKWMPDPSGPRVHQAKEIEKSPDLKSHPKVTLMQLLLERRNNDKGNKASANPDLHHDATPSLSLPRGPLRGASPWDEGRTQSPLDRPGPLPPPLPLYNLGREPGSTPSPYSYQSSPHVQSSPLDLCKSKPYPIDKASEPAFSASKLLQNLAQCGAASPSPPMPPGKPPSQELETGRPLALLERLNAPVQRSAPTPLSDGPSGSGAPFRRREASPPPASQIENLLERRTVLQLLLGTGAAASTPPAAASGRRERSSGGSGRRSAEGTCFDKPSASSSSSVICDSSDGSAAAAADVKVKTEPAEEVSVSSPAPPADVPGRKRRSSADGRSPFSEARRDLKVEPRPAEVIAKYGLLSQLLKQQTATYYTASAQTETRLGQVKEEQKEHQGSVPKKRRLCPELAESLSNGSPHRPGDGPMSALKEGPDLRSFRSPKEEEHRPARSPQGGESLPKESRGFNVLKQLLLSDNCLKELSQHSRGAPSPSSLLQVNGKANGGVLNQPGYNHQLLHLPWHQHASLSSGPPQLPSHLRPLLTPPMGDGSHRGPWGHHAAPLQDSPKREPPPPVKREAESPVRWGGREEGGEGGREGEEEEEACDSSPDSPRLTRSNPILYYMLQKGSAQLRREMARDQGEGPPGAGVRVKEEPVADLHAYDHRQNSSQRSSPHNDKHSHRSHGLSQSSDKW